VVIASASGREDPGSYPAWVQGFIGKTWLCSCINCCNVCEIKVRNNCPQKYALKTKVFTFQNGHFVPTNFVPSVEGKRGWFGDNRRNGIITFPIGSANSYPLNNTFLRPPLPTTITTITTTIRD
jgi:hypothetical protein